MGLGPLKCKIYKFTYGFHSDQTQHSQQKADQPLAETLNILKNL